MICHFLSGADLASSRLLLDQLFVFVVCRKEIERLVGTPLNVFREIVVLFPKLREGFRLEDHGRDLLGAASFMGRALPSAMSLFTFSTK